MLQNLIKVRDETGTINPSKCLICPPKLTSGFRSFGHKPSDFMEFVAFETIRKYMCDRFEGVTEGKMMSSPAIHFRGKVFAFFSRQDKMVFRLGEHPALTNSTSGMRPFSPFKKKKPLKGWYEVDFERQAEWKQLAEVALERFKSESHGGKRS